MDTSLWKVFDHFEFFVKTYQVLIHVSSCFMFSIFESYFSVVNFVSTLVITTSLWTLFYMFEIFWDCSGFDSFVFICCFPNFHNWVFVVAFLLDFVDTYITLDNLGGFWDLFEMFQVLIHHIHSYFSLLCDNQHVDFPYTLFINTSLWKTIVIFETSDICW